MVNRKTNRRQVTGKNPANGLAGDHNLRACSGEVPGKPSDPLEEFRTRLENSREFCLKHQRPFIALSYAQSVDGSIATRNRQPLRLSGPQSMTLTHTLRASCDAILIGIGTLLADDPQLTVRLVDGKNPQPIVLDTRLRTPPTARLLQRMDRSAWIINGPQTPKEQVRRLAKIGATPLSCITGADGKIDLPALMLLLFRRNIHSVMVEGGAQVITSFVNFRLVDQLIITVAPKMVGGLPVIDAERINASCRFHLHNVSYQFLDEDLVIWARPSWESE
jgi:riboflavin-specific deaminase-like protein